MLTYKQKHQWIRLKEVLQFYTEFDNFNKIKAYSNWRFLISIRKQLKKQCNLQLSNKKIISNLLNQYDNYFYKDGYDMYINRYCLEQIFKTKDLNYYKDYMLKYLSNINELPLLPFNKLISIESLDTSIKKDYIKKLLKDLKQYNNKIYDVLLEPPDITLNLNKTTICNCNYLTTNKNNTPDIIFLLYKSKFDDETLIKDYKGRINFIDIINKEIKNIRNLINRDIKKE